RKDVIRFGSRRECRNLGRTCDREWRAWPRSNRVDARLCGSGCIPSSIGCASPHGSICHENIDMTVGPFLSSSWYRVAQRKPKLRDHTSVYRHRYRGSVWYVVQDHATGRVHRLSPAGYMIVAAMDGVQTVDQLWLEAGSHLAEDAPSQGDVIQLLAELNAADLLQTDVTPDSDALEERAARARRFGWLGNVLYPLALRVPLWYPDRFFERTRPLANWLFGLPGALLWLLVVLPALVLAAQHWEELGANASDRILAADNLLPLA